MDVERQIDRMSGSRGLGGGSPCRVLGFTLIELLVVVAIIALLLSILLPSLSRVRDAARATVCGSRIRESTRGAAMALVSAQQDRLQTNFGWATTSLKNMGGQAEVFTCPADLNPVPTPALFDRMYEGTIYRGETSADGPYNYMGRVSDGRTYRVNIQDSIDGDYFGRDGGGGGYDTAGNFQGDIDVELEWTASAQQKTATVYTRTFSTGWRHTLMNYQGKFIGDASNRPRFGAPLMWGSYGLNVSAGLKSVKGNPVLIAECKKWSVFPETLRSAKTTSPYPADNLRQTLRFRHGGNWSNRLMVLADPKDGTYQPKQYMNMGFLDTHVERQGPEKVTAQSSVRGGYSWDGWYGIRRGGASTF